MVVDAGVDNADANPLAGGREITAIPDVGCPDERDTRRGQRPELRHRLYIDHAVESAKLVHLAKRKPYLDRVGQAAEPRLDHPADLAKACHDRVLLRGDFGDTSTGSLGDFAIVQAPIAKPHSGIRRRFAGKHRKNQASLRPTLSAKRLASTGQTNANWEIKTAPSKATRHARKMPVLSKRSEPLVEGTAQVGS